MPYKDGIETILELRKSRPSLKIIAISGGGRCEPEGYLETAKSSGADRTLTKPFSKNEIVKAVEELLGQEQVSPCSHAGETSHRADS
jgi:DNA-binding NarL/FixJ family response regulator